MAMAIIVFGFGSLMLLSAAVIGMAVFLRNQWDQPENHR
jgi:hypothetical protein